MTIKTGAFVLALLMGACGQTGETSDVASAGFVPADEVRQTTRTERTEKATPVDAARTIKPGALVDFSHDFRFPPEAGQANVVTVTMRHGYQNGTLALTATSDDGLTLFLPTATRTLTMSGTGQEDWELSFEPEETGVGYISIAAEVTASDGGITQRSYAIRVDTRTSSQKATISAPAEEIIMEADETISE